MGAAGGTALGSGRAGMVTGSLSSIPAAFAASEKADLAERSGGRPGARVPARWAAAGADARGRPGSPGVARRSSPTHGMGRSRLPSLLRPPFATFRRTTRPRAGRADGHISGYHPPDGWVTRKAAVEGGDGWPIARVRSSRTRPATRSSASRGRRTQPRRRQPRRTQPRRTQPRWTAPDVMATGGTRRKALSTRQLPRSALPTCDCRAVPGVSRFRRRGRSSPHDREARRRRRDRRRGDRGPRCPAAGRLPAPPRSGGGRRARVSDRPRDGCGRG